MTQRTLAIPLDAAIRMHVRPGTPHPYLIAVARPPTQAAPEAILQANQICAAVTCDTGQAWLDPLGEQLVDEVLTRGGGALVAFASLADALACARRMEAGRA